MYNKYDKCNFCVNRGVFTCLEKCDRITHEWFVPNKNDIIAFSKSEGLSVADVIALINLE